MKYKQKGTEIGTLVERKNAAYGDSFVKSGDILKIIYPDGIALDQYDDMLALIRVIDKIFRIATKRDAFNENSWDDIAGYAILKSANTRKKIEKMEL